MKRRNPAGFFDAPESVQAQRKRLEAETLAKKRKEDREKLEERASRKLVGRKGDIGQQDLFGGGDLFSNPKRSMAKRKRKAHKAKRSARKVRRTLRRKARVIKVNPKRRRLRKKVQRAIRTVKQARRAVKRSMPKPGYTAIRVGSKYQLCRVQGSKLSRIGTFNMSGLRKWCKAHGIKCR